MAGNIYIEENGVYQLDCSAALWSTDQIHNLYHSVGSFLCDADFVIETSEFLLLIEYKNANIPGAAHPEAFDPKSQKKVDNIARKFYDSLNYLRLEGKLRPLKYVYIVESTNAGTTDRKLLRDAISQRLPFEMQRNKPSKLIESFDVLSISEWNNHPKYSVFTLSPVVQIDAT